MSLDAVYNRQMQNISTFRSFFTKFGEMEENEDGGGEKARKLAALHCCPTCNQDCEVALRLRRHMEANRACLEETRCTLDQFMRRLHSKKKMLTRDKEKYNQYTSQYLKQKVSAISVVIPRSFQFPSSGIKIVERVYKGTRTPRDRGTLRQVL